MGCKGGQLPSVTENHHAELLLQTPLQDQVLGGADVHVAVAPSRPLDMQRPPTAGGTGQLSLGNLGEILSRVPSHQSAILSTCAQNRSLAQSEKSRHTLLMCLDGVALEVLTIVAHRVCAQAAFIVTSHQIATIQESDTVVDQSWRRLSNVGPSKETVLLPVPEGEMSSSSVGDQEIAVKRMEADPGDGGGVPPDLSQPLYQIKWNMVSEKYRSPGAGIPSLSEWTSE